MSYIEVLDELEARPRRWLLTGVAGFIGSNLLERLLLLGQEVVGVDNFSTGSPENLTDVRRRVGPELWSRLSFTEADIEDLETCRDACAGVDIVLHQAALGSVPRSVEDPIGVNSVNVTGFLNLLVASRDANVGRFVYAASSSTYGDHPDPVKVEGRIGAPLSPYAVTKYVNELYASVFSSVYGMDVIGLRYFNVFGRRQNPHGAYAAVIPLWIGNLLSGEPCVINGDGETSRDFCYIDNVVQANLLAAVAPASEVKGEVFNIAVGDSTTLKELFDILKNEAVTYRAEAAAEQAVFGPFRPADVRHSRADISKARQRLGYEPSHTLRDGVREALAWYAHRADTRSSDTASTDSRVSR